ncbi:MAG: hypothetical protein WC768_01085 [Patescibacteria group bacterium]|jgi:photosystem II stability/assembly factor-like uncharacterized protein
MKKIKILFSLLLTGIFISGCSINFGGGANTTVIAGVFKSFDKSGTWQEKNLFLHSGGSGSIAGVNVLGLTFDPQDNRAIYLNSDGSGLLYSYDGGDSWRKADAVGNGRVESVAIDPKNKCVIYATSANTILKSIDCNRSWKEVYIDTRADKAVTALAIDSYDSLIIYAGNSAGDIFKSVDGGSNWQVIDRLNNPAAKILIDKKDTRTIYVATKNQGIFKTTDSGSSWTDVNGGLKQYSAALEYKNLIFDPNQDNSLLLVSKYGLIKTNDGGKNWEAIKLITPPSTTDIYSVAINPKNNLEIYYATASTFYKTVDGGKNWVTKRLPTAAVATYLIIDPNDQNIIYLGLANLNRK